MTSQSPMNISKSHWDNYCDEKCAYSFDYKTSSNCNVNNYGSYLQLSYDSSNPPPVTFNTYTYYVEKIEIYSPSIHLFNGVQVDGELIITHSPTSMGAPLMVCIPLSSAKMQTTASTQIITDIINGSTQLKPNSGEAASVKLNDYNLNSIVPRSPFYYYEDNNGNNIVVYGLQDAISISSVTINTLKTMITATTDIKYPTVDYYYLNKNGPTVGGGNGDGQIYIDCQPTGNSEDTTAVEYSKPAIVNNLGNFFNSQIAVFLVAAFIFVVLIILIHKLFVYLSGDTARSAAKSARNATASTLTAASQLASAAAGVVTGAATATGKMAKSAAKSAVKSAAGLVSSSSKGTRNSDTGGIEMKTM
jgi:carbonic anhydrase